MSCGHFRSYIVYVREICKKNLYKQMFRPKILNNSIQGPCDIGTSFKNIFAFYRKKMCVIVNYVYV